MAVIAVLVAGVQRRTASVIATSGAYAHVQVTVLRELAAHPQAFVLAGESGWVIAGVCAARCMTINDPCGSVSEQSATRTFLCRPAANLSAIVELAATALASPQ